jgi:two-component system response regulator YesN
MRLDLRLQRIVFGLSLPQVVKEVRKAAVDHLFSKEGRVSLTTLPEGQLSIIYASTCSSPPSSIPLSVLRFERGLMELVQRYAEQHRLSVTPLQTGLCHGMEKILHELSELQTWGSMRTVIPFGRCVKLEELMSDREAYQHSQLLNLARRVEKISTQYHTGDYLQYTKEVTLLSKDIRGLAPRDTERISFIQQFLERSLGVPVGDAKLDQWIRQLEIHGETNLLHALESGADSRDLVQLVIDYIDRNYMHDIGIGQIAQEVGVTYNYLSTIFHKKCGMTFIHYLTKTRMLKAKQLLLSHPHMKIQNVANEVGYYSTRYFTKAFTKQFNCYPSEIRAVQQV